LSQRRVFDADHYMRLSVSRLESVKLLVAALKTPQAIKTAADIGCGVGFFSAYLESEGFRVTAVDGRQDNVDEAAKRVPAATITRMNVEDSALQDLGNFDLVLCLGLLYHLENPFQTIRSLHRITGKVLIAESVIFPGSEPIMGLVDEGQEKDQGLNHIAFYPTESCLVKMFFRAGFKNVYRCTQMPEHPDFRPPRGHRRVRTMLAAANTPLAVPLLEALQEPKTTIQPWASDSAEKQQLLRKIYKFAEKPLPEKILAAKKLLGEK
jgi:SAM-dependent methyltransferase